MITNDENRKREEQILEKELGSIFGDSSEIVDELRDAAKKAEELAEFCGLNGIIALKGWDADKGAKALSIGVDLLARGRDLDSFARRLRSVAKNAEGKEEER